MQSNDYCGDPGALVSYLYNDGTAEELTAIAAHVETCDACTRELALLGDTREQLAAWIPPEAQLGFTVSREPVRESLPSLVHAETAVERMPVPWWRQSAPVWMQAAAALVVFGAGLAVGTSGRSGEAPGAGATNAAVSKTDLASLEQRLRAELTRTASPAAVTASTVGTLTPVHVEEAGHDETLLRRVRALVTESEERQRQELAMRTQQVMRDFEIQRKVDMATVQQNIGQIQGTTGAELRRTSELYNLLMNNVSLPGR
jgi:hypothetical protein